MNPYDQAHALAKSLKESEEYTEYMRLKQVAYDDSTNKALLDEYKRLQFRMQAKLASGENMPEEDLQRLQQIGALLQFNPDVSAYLMAEFRFQRMLSDIFKILADVAGIDLDMLSQGMSGGDGCLRSMGRATDPFGGSNGKQAKEARLAAAQAALPIGKIQHTRPARGPGIRHVLVCLAVEDRPARADLPVQRADGHRHGVGGL